MPAPSFRLLDRFEHTFLGTKYRHRDSSLGNKIGRELFEDLILHRSDSLLAQRAATNTVVVNSEGKIHRQHRLIRRNDSVMGLPPAGVMNLRQLPLQLSAWSGRRPSYCLRSQDRGEIASEADRPCAVRSARFRGRDEEA